METEQDKKRWSLIRNDNGEWISDEYAVFVSELEATVLRVYAAKQGKSLAIQHGQDGLLWCYKHEVEQIDLTPQETERISKNLKIKKVYKRIYEENDYICDKKQSKYKKLHIMDQTLILQKIHEIIGNENVRFPSQITISVNNKKLSMYVKGNGVRDNMQTDGSAFEGWAICLRACLPKEIETLELGWEEPKYSANEEERNKQEKHYNRFVMRASLFEDVFDWVSIKPENREEVQRVHDVLSTLFINYPKSGSKKKVTENGKVNKGEAKLERQLLEKMLKTIAISDHQLPVGLFVNEVKTENTYTPRGASQIDLWQLDEGCLRIFELKDAKNDKVGIISELMFYANTMRLLIEGVIKYPDSLNKEKNYYRHIHDLYLAIKNKEVKRIEAVFLNFAFHPLIDYCIDNVLAILNSGMEKVNISFRKMRVNDILEK